MTINKTKKLLTKKYYLYETLMVEFSVSISTFSFKWQHATN